MEMVSNPHASNLVAWAKDRPEVVVLSGDLTGSTEIAPFKKAYPDRFFSMGLSEQNMVGFAGGLAREGYTPFLHTFAVFLYRRALDQIEMSVAYPKLRVRFFGFLPGITTPGGVTHQAIDDVGVLRPLPNMTILSTGDATDVESMLDAAQAVDGPVYVRMLRGELPRLFDRADPLVVGRARVISAGTDVTLLSEGICTEEAMRAARALQARGVGVQHLHVSTLKPFDDPAVIEAMAGARHGVITMENHSIIGGLGSAAAELLAGHGIGKRLVRIGIPDTYAHGASRPYLMKEYGLDAAALVAQVEALIGEKLGIDEQALAAVRLDAVNTQDKLEAL